MNDKELSKFAKTTCFCLGELQGLRQRYRDAEFPEEVIGRLMRMLVDVACEQNVSLGHAFELCSPHKLEKPEEAKKAEP